MFTLVTLYAVASIWVVPTGEVREFNFVSEQGSITVLSAIFLAMGCAFAFTSFHFSERVSHQVFWFGFFAAMGFLAMDERCNSTNGWAGTWIGIKWPKRHLRHFVIQTTSLLLPMALFVLLFFLPTALQYQRFLQLFGLTFSFYVVHTIIDSPQKPPTTVSMIREEHRPV
ncbi:MAG: hypothetical protein CMJ78_17645 [Planctomycetaceae bacterium]|nr:hypothetical protein [Planctomycetaceae bacterium]